MVINSGKTTRTLLQGVIRVAIIERTLLVQPSHSPFPPLSPLQSGWGCALGLRESRQLAPLCLQMDSPSLLSPVEVMVN